MNEKLKTVGDLIQGIVIFVLAIKLLYVFFLFFTEGPEILAKIYPFMETLFAIATFVSIFSLFPTALFRRSRGIAGAGLYIASYIYSATLWVWAFLLTYTLWGWWALVIGLLAFGIGVVPIAMLATIFKSDWFLLGNLVLVLVLTFGTRMLGMYLKKKYEEQSMKFNGRTTFEIDRQPLFR
jgi:hypothetical protein